jgi:hypothetical protein
MRRTLLPVIGVILVVALLSAVLADCANRRDADRLPTERLRSDILGLARREVWSALRCWPMPPIDFLPAATTDDPSRAAG